MSRILNQVQYRLRFRIYSESHLFLLVFFHLLSPAWGTVLSKRGTGSYSSKPLSTLNFRHIITKPKVIKGEGDNFVIPECLYRESTLLKRNMRAMFQISAKECSRTVFHHGYNEDERPHSFYMLLFLLVSSDRANFRSSSIKYCLRHSPPP